MKYISFYLLISLLAFTIGFSLVWISRIKNEDPLPLNPQPTALENLTTESPAEFKHQKRFIPTGRGCGLGYFQGYRTNDGQHLSEGVTGYRSYKETGKEFKKILAKAVRIVERFPKYKNHLGDIGERVILINPPDKNGKETISILWYGGKDYIQYVNAPSVDLALEFEQFLESIDYASAF